MNLLRTNVKKDKVQNVRRPKCKVEKCDLVLIRRLTYFKLKPFKYLFFTPCTTLISHLYHFEYFR